MSIQKLIISTIISLSIFSIQGSDGKIVSKQEQQELFEKWGLLESGRYHRADPGDSIGWALGEALKAQLDNKEQTEESIIKELKKLIPIVLIDRKEAKEAKEAIEFLKNISHCYLSLLLRAKKNIRLPEFIKSLEPEILEYVDCKEKDSKSLYEFLRRWPVALNHLIYNHSLPITSEDLCFLIKNIKVNGFSIGDTEYQGEAAKAMFNTCFNGELEQTQESLVKYFKELLKPSDIKKNHGQRILTFMLCLNRLCKGNKLRIKPPNPILLNLIIPQILCNDSVVNAVNEYRLNLESKKNDTNRNEAVNKFYCHEFASWYKNKLKESKKNDTNRNEAVNKFLCNEFDSWYKNKLKNCLLKDL